MVAFKVSVAVLLCVGTAFAIPAGGKDLKASAQTPAQAAQAPPRPQINWGKCAQLQPSEAERTAKAQVIDQCLDKVPLPDVDTANDTVIQQHRQDVTTCALQQEGWFNSNGQYRFDRARTEIVNKKLASNVEPEVLAKHEECKKEAEEKFPKNFVAQVQLYQACMDYHISQICGIQIATDAHPQQG